MASQKDENTSVTRPQITLNEAINFNLKSIFIAIPKTGTTSVVSQIKPLGKPLIQAPHLNIVQVRDTIYTYLLKLSLGRNLGYPTQGVVSDQQLREESRRIFDTFFKFASVRNPWARAVSLYSRREGVRVAGHISFQDFCERHIYASDTCIYPTLHANQIDWLTDESGNMVMDYIYKVENFDKAIEEIYEQTDGRIQLKVKRANHNPQSQSQSYRDLYNDHTRQLIAKRFEKDIDYFKYAF